MDQRRKIKASDIAGATEGNPIATINGGNRTYEVYVAANKAGYLVIELTDGEPEITAVCFPGRLENSVYMQAMFYAADSAWRDSEAVA